MTEEIKNPEHEKLLEVLKFTPRTYKISMWGYGGEKVMGTVDRKIYDYFRSRRLDLSDYCWDSDYADDHNIPEEFQPFPSGAWYECDGLGHVHGVNRDAGTIQIEDETGETVYQRQLDSLTGFDEEEPEPEFDCGDEVWIDQEAAGTVVFLGNSNEKGTFFEADLELKAPFDISKLVLGYDEIDGEPIINRVTYDGEDIDNWGGSTDGKSSDFAFYIAGSKNEKGNWEKYANMDDIEYPMTEWFPKKIKPVRVGNYMVKTAGKNSWEQQCKWTGDKWVNSWTEPADYNDPNREVKIRAWQGLAIDPDAEQTEARVQDLESALEELKAEFDSLIKYGSVACFSCGAEYVEHELVEMSGQYHCPSCGQGWVMMEDRGV